MEQTGFNIYEQITPINQDLTIIFNPNPSYKSYKLLINKDDNPYKEITKINMDKTEFTLSETGTYQIIVTYTGETENEYIETSGIYIIDKEAPVLNVGKNYVEIYLGKKLDIMGTVTANDNLEGNITSNIKTNKENINFEEKGIKKLIYTVSDEAGNTSTKEVIVNVMHSSVSIFIFQMFFITVLSIIALAILIYNKSIKLEKRISRFSINPIKDTTISLFDGIFINIRNVIKKINNILNKSEFMKKYSKRYSRYIKVNNTINRGNMDFISIKILSSILAIIVAIFAKTIQFKVFKTYEIYIPMVFGFFLPDFIYYYKYKTYRKKLENDMLQAIIIMNNAFKSGRSITQAITLVSNELEGPMAEEFKKMYLELSFGLGIDIVFKRLYERIQIEEIAYLTASLTILNLTGGNIVEVFESIEKSLFNKKKLKLELKSLTSGSRMIVNVLTIVPIAFILLIWIINPTFFMPLLTSKLGFILIGTIIIYYVLYIIVVRKMLRVKI